MTLKRQLMNGFLRVKNQMSKFLKDETGATDIIAIILVVIVVIALVGIFRTQLTEILNGLFDQIKNSLGI